MSSDSERRKEAREPIRLRVTYKSARALLSEYTTSLSRGGCTIKSKTAVETDRSFIFELTAEGMERKVLEIEGRVVHCTQRPDGDYSVGIEYQPLSSPRRIATSRFLDQVFAEHLAKRGSARVPVNLVAEDAVDRSRYLVRDLSRGGMGLRLPAERKLPVSLQLGQRAEVTIIHDGDLSFVLNARIARLSHGDPPKEQAAIGLQFQDLGEANMRIIDALLYLHRPQAVLISFLA